MNARTRSAAAGAGAAVVLLLAGCSSDQTETPTEDDQTAEIAEAARTYQEAVIAQDAQASCEARTPEFRGGSMAECLEREERAPERDADTGQVTAGEPFEIAASGGHPAGWGVLVEYDYTHPGQEPETARHAVRLVQEEQGGPWLVDQAEPILEDDMAASTDPARDALLGR